MSYATGLTQFSGMSIEATCFMAANHLSPWFIVLTVAALGCSDASSPAATGDLILEVTAGGAQVGLAGEELPDPVVVRVTTPDGRPVPRVLINFVVSAGGGHVFA